MSFKVYALYGQSGHYTWASLIGQMSFKAFRSLVTSLGYSVCEYSGPRSEEARSVAQGLNLPEGCFWTVRKEDSSVSESGQTAFYGVAVKPYETRRKQRG